MLEQVAQAVRRKSYRLLAGYSLIALIGLLDYLVGYEISLSLFYLIPIGLLAWFAGARHGVMAALLGALVWLTADLAAGHAYSQPAIYYWNTFVRLGFFLIVTLLLARLKGSLLRERELAHTDHLTGAANSRLFYELAAFELNRARRYHRPFTIAYIDLDNFKAVNDSLGHTTGDTVLQATVKTAKTHLRGSDVVARVGGDEFVLLLPETNQEAAQTIVNKIHESLLAEMKKHAWPITFSVGVLTCLAAPSSIDELIRRSDQLMYSVKLSGRNAVRYALYAGETNESGVPPMRDTN